MWLLGGFLTKACTKPTKEKKLATEGYDEYLDSYELAAECRTCDSIK